MLFNRGFLLFLVGSVVFFTVTDVFGAAMAQRRQQQMQQQQMMQQQAYQQAYQQAVAQRQAQEMAAYQQAMAQRQAVMQQQAAQQKAAMEYAAYKQAMQQAVAKRNAELQAVAQAKQQIAQRQAQQVEQYKAAVAQKQVAQVVAYQQARMTQQAVGQKVQANVNDQVREYASYLAARKAALERQGVLMQQAAVEQKVLQSAAVQRVQVAQARAVAEQKIAAEAVGRSVMGKKLATDVMAARERDARLRQGQPEDASVVADTIVDIQQLWDSLDNSSEAWGQIVDKEIKLLTVSEYIDRFRKLNIKINKTPGHYAGLIDALAEQMTGFLSAPFMNVLSYGAIMEYDFENGANKEDLARQVLGPDQYETNRRRVFGH